MVVGVDAIPYLQFFHLCVLCFDLQRVALDGDDVIDGADL